ncbi:hypothetical protein C672_3636 [[Clostridium] bifermentans ATCC 638]|uniref:Uncharacterized protein n=1 Tax=Paraclostridium bifermentans ATCC 638 = DSM 14991 TaxID=1233171 RepID=T4VGA5_PARBF|nr:hypothetical protein [Paraclostridium bifermentans]EQK39796.1 hypothetical protein C672_3636 [[Clostridium] bifermentans ATCC 638] [Paraclostridium bifermentans ATCC 638 = DSM 14991]
MLTYKDILYSVTKLLNAKYKDINIFDKNQAGMFEGECFYVKLIPLETNVNSNTSNSKGVVISVKYFSDDDLKRYDIASDLNIMFARTLKVKDRVLSISNTEANFFEDEVSEVLDFLITIKYVESVEIAKEYRELIGSVTIRI